MLAEPTHYPNPFPFFHVTAAFSAAECRMLERVFLQDGAWQARDAAFYRCSLREVTEEIPAPFRTAVSARMREITGQPLVNRVVVTAQQMLPGQHIGLHSDRPLLGYETARLVLQLNQQWQPDHGGVLELFAAPEGAATFRVNPRHNEAFGFLLHANSYHAVTEVTQPRQSLVFNFWHAANTPELAAYVQTLFSNVHFSELPVALNPVASAAESSLPEDTTFLASTAALALQRWGYTDTTVVLGYRYSAGLSVDAASDTEAYAAIRLADWIAHLHRDVFDLARWEILRRELVGPGVFPRLLPAWHLCLPTARADQDRTDQDRHLINPSQ